MPPSRFRPRFTVRRMMIAVGIVGILVGLGMELKRRQRRFSKLAFTHWIGAIAEDGERKQNWHTRMWFKYDHAARYPWLPVAPDPPEPE